MANKFVTAIFGDYSKKEVKKLKKTVDKINALESKYKEMDDKELASQTKLLKERLSKGETLDDILPDAFAVCREASDRVLGMRHFDVQLIGGIVLHQGRIAEMKTGEGKTLVATLPAYLNALTGKGVGYLAVCHMTPPDQNICIVENLLCKSAVGIGKSCASYFNIVLLARKIGNGTVNTLRVNFSDILVLYFMLIFIPNSYSDHLLFLLLCFLIIYLSLLLLTFHLIQKRLP